MMKFKDKILIVLLLLSFGIFIIYQIKSVLTPFIISLIIAYFLHPLVDKLQIRHHIPRNLSTLIILLIFFAIVTGLFLITIPLLYKQSLQLLENLPRYTQTISQDIYPKIIESLNGFGFRFDKDLSHVLANEEFTGKFGELIKNIFLNTISSSASIINILSLIFIMPILVFYLLKDWDRLVKSLNNNLPHKISKPIRQLSSNIDKALAGFIRGQIQVCLILGFIYATLLSFCKLDYGFLIGLMTGIFSFIPYIGMLCGVTIAIVVALFQWGIDFTNIALVSGVFVIGQIIESNFLTPNLIGNKIGLHPVWIIFGLFFFGTLFGVIGIIFAVPLSAIFGVIIKYLISNYNKKNHDS
ncbi:AI-2E family transporter [Alphaproteobacteria bacterium]|nr:AI-2E family transporter [Alphaproteobacteria bacterium]